MEFYTAVQNVMLPRRRKINQMRLMERLENDERLEALLDDLERKAPDVRGSSLPPPDDSSYVSHISQDMRCVSGL